MNAAVPRWRIKVLASLKSSASRHGLPAIWPVTGMSIGHGPGRRRNSSASPLRRVKPSTWPRDAPVMAPM
jgi:hypothetical protein